MYFFKILFVTWCKGTATIYYFFGHLTSAITSGVEQINSKLIVYIRDFKSSKKFELLPPEVTKKRSLIHKVYRAFFMRCRHKFTCVSIRAYKKAQSRSKRAKASFLLSKPYLPITITAVAV